MILNEFWLPNCGFEVHEGLPEPQEIEPYPQVVHPVVAPLDDLSPLAQQVLSAIRAADGLLAATLGLYAGPDREEAAMRLAVYLYQGHRPMVDDAMVVWQEAGLESIESLFQILEHLNRGFMR